MAANQLRGEVELMDGHRVYRLVFDPNAFCAIEGELGITTDQLLERVAQSEGKRDQQLIRALLWGGLQRYHPCRIERAGEILRTAGWAACQGATFLGLGAAFGLKEEGKEEPDPRQPAGYAGTGSRFTSAIAKLGAIASPFGRRRRA